MSVTSPGSVELDTYESQYTPEQVEASIGKGTIIQNGTFWVWNVETMQYQDTGVYATPGPGSIVTEMLADGAVTWPKLAPEARKSNDNLLDNWYFVGGGSQQGGGQFPINQRGLLEYAGAVYGIDRWIGRASNQRVVLAADGLEIHAGENQADIHQPMIVDSGLVGKTVTLSAIACGDGTYAPNIGVLSNPQQGNVAGTPSTDWQLLSTTVVISASAQSIINPRIFVSAGGGHIKVMAMKFEEGPIQTLAYESAGGGWQLNDPAPNFADELMRCQRYQRLILNGTPLSGLITASGATFETKFPYGMRNANPAFLFDGAKANIRTVSGYSSAGIGADITSVTINGNGRRIIFKVNNGASIGENNTPAILTLDGADIIIDKNL